jgi:hypothetical protein
MNSLIGACVAVAATGLVFAPQAAANPGVDGFVYDVSAAGFNIDSANEMAYVALGLGICVDLFSGATVGSVTTQAKQITSMTAADAMEFVGLAVENLCPNAIYADSVA